MENQILENSVFIVTDIKRRPRRDAGAFFCIPVT